MTHGCCEACTLEAFEEIGEPVIMAQELRHDDPTWGEWVELGVGG